MKAVATHVVQKAANVVRGGGAQQQAYTNIAEEDDSGCEDLDRILGSALADQGLFVHSHRHLSDRQCANLPSPPSPSRCGIRLSREGRLLRLRRPPSEVHPLLLQATDLKLWGQIHTDHGHKLLVRKGALVGCYGGGQAVVLQEDSQGRWLAVSADGGNSGDSLGNQGSNWCHFRCVCLDHSEDTELCPYRVLGTHAISGHHVSKWMLSTLDKESRGSILAGKDENAWLDCSCVLSAMLRLPVGLSNLISGDFPGRRRCPCA